jgi:uncharacterized membrane protein YoaK (UPF0700 family)
LRDPTAPRLPAALLVLTFVTGLVDAVSYVGLGRVFTSNMTGNVVFLGFALGGATGLSPFRSLLALLAFVLGALAGGSFAARARQRRSAHLVKAAVVEASLLAVASGVGFLEPRSPSPAVVHALIVLTAVAMGFRNAIVRALSVHDLTTTVLTLTITGLVADSSLAGGENPRVARRLLSIATMLIGALAGAVLLRLFGSSVPLLLASLLVAATGAWAHRGDSSRR